MSLADGLRDLAGGGVTTLRPDAPGAPCAIVAVGERMTAATANLMASRGHSLLSVCLPRSRYDALGLPPADVDRSVERPFAARLSIEATEGVSTGISAEDRARTVRAAAGAGGVRASGHVLIAPGADRGVLGARGLREAAADLAVLAGASSPVSVICPALDARGEPLTAWGGTATTVSVAEVVAHRVTAELTIRRMDGDIRATTNGRFRTVAYDDAWRGLATVAFAATGPRAGRAALTGLRTCTARAACRCHEHLAQLLRGAAATGGAVLRILAPPDVAGPCGDPPRDVGERAYVERLIELVAADLDLPVQTAAPLPCARAA